MNMSKDKLIISSKEVKAIITKGKKKKVKGPSGRTYTRILKGS